MMSTLTSAGRTGASRARFFLTASITATVFSPDWRRTSRMTVGAPFTRTAERCSLVPSSACPMSRTRIGAPLMVATTRSLNDRGSTTRPMVRSDCSCRPAVTLPPGRSAFCRTMASRTAVIGIW